MLLGRVLDETYEPIVRKNLTLVTVARLTTNSAFRYVIPFLSVLARGLDVSISQIGVVLTISTLTGLLGSPIGRFIDRGSHRVLIVYSLVGIALGAAIAAFAPGVWLFGVGLVILGVAKLVFDMALTGWVSEYVPPQGRGRVFGLIEMSWAAGLFLGVTLLGIITAIWSWRWAYATAAAALVVVAVVAFLRLPPDRRRFSAHDVAAISAPRERPSARAWQFVVAMGFMLISIQMLIAVLGPWLQDDHGFGSGGLAVVTFGLGVFELVSSFAAIRLTDVWGGWRSVMRGGMLLVPASLLFVLTHQYLWLGLVAFAFVTLGFEYCIISSFSVATTLVNGAPAAGLGLMFTFNTAGMAAGTLLGTWLYDHHGPGVAVSPVIGTSTVAVVMLALGLSSPRRRATSDAPPTRT
jgi:predicted MFS family arabinose efflux permease